MEARAAGVRVFTYGLAMLDNPTRMDFAAAGAVTNSRGGYDFNLIVTARDVFAQSTRVSLQVPGLHNVLNAAAAMGTAHLLGLPMVDAGEALGEYLGTERRFDLRGEAAGVTVIDDYAHHPTEIRATLAAARARFPQRELWAVWQPHTFSRTRALLQDFAIAFSDAQHVLITDIYAARESTPGDGFTSQQVIAAMRHPDVRYTPGLQDAQAELARAVKAGSVVLVLSAGDADQVSAGYLNTLRSRNAHAGDRHASA
jgi:UDP-N-acetylmuramate--alanine ligase